MLVHVLHALTLVWLCQLHCRRANHGCTVDTVHTHTSRSDVTVTQQRQKFLRLILVGFLHGEGRVVVCVMCDDKAAHEAIRAEESDVE